MRQVNKAHSMILFVTPCVLIIYRMV